MSGDFSDATKWAVDLQQAANRIPERAKLATRKAAFDIERDAKIFAPVLTGFLESSITVTFTGNAMETTAVIGPTAFYGLYVELGTSTMGPKPYMGPATDRHEGPYIQAMESLGLQVVRG